MVAAQVGDCCYCSVVLVNTVSVTKVEEEVSDGVDAGVSDSMVDCAYRG